MIHRARLTNSARFYYARAAAIELHLTGPMPKCGDARFPVDQATVKYK